jgi:hypothetical protein
VSFTVFFSYFYIKYDRIIEKRFRSPAFRQCGQDLRAAQDGAGPASRFRPRRLRPSCGGPGIQKNQASLPLGSFRLLNDGIEITPGPESYHSPEPARISIHDGQVDEISSNGQRSFGLRTGAATGDGAVRFRAAVQAATGEVQRDSPGDGAGGAGHRRPELSSSTAE